MSENKTIVNSWNEWDPLKHVIVGRADGTCIPAPEPALDAKVPEDSDMRGQFGPRTKDTVDKANELLDNFSNMLEKRGIKVDRPTPIDFNQKTSTPDWEAETMFGCMPPRDVLLTVGNEILEATMSYRCRWFEYLCYRPLLKDYYNQDPNMRHESAPKPRLTDADYRKDYLSDKIGVQKRLEWTEKKYFVTTEEEPLFDAADVLRFGKDLVVQHVEQLSLFQISIHQLHQIAVLLQWLQNIFSRSTLIFFEHQFYLINNLFCNLHPLILVLEQTRVSCLDLDYNNLLKVVGNINIQTNDIGNSLLLLKFRFLLLTKHLLEAYNQTWFLLPNQV